MALKIQRCSTSLIKIDAQHNYDTLLTYQVGKDQQMH